MNITDYFSIGRPLDFSYKTNKAIAGIMLFAFIIGIVVNALIESTISEIFLKAFLFFLSVFLTWAFAREIDPDNDYSAFVGVFFIFSLLYLWQKIDFVMVFWFILAVRIINRSTGVPARIIDVSFLIILSLAIAYFVGPEFALLSSFLLSIDFMFDRNQKFEMVFILLGILIFVVVFFLFDLTWFSNFISIEYLWLSVVFISLFLITIITTKELKSKCDVTKVLIVTNRVKATQIFVLLSITIVLLLYGNEGFSYIFPIWCAIGGVGVFRIGKIIKNLKKIS